MKSQRRCLTAASFLALTTLMFSGAFARAAENDSPIEDPGWPRVIVRDEVTNTVYQPQLGSWDYVTWKARSAVTRQPAGAPQPTFGTIDIQAATRVDRAEREVYFDRIQIVNCDFPSEPEKASEHLQALRSLLPTELRGISLDRMEASLAILQARQSAGEPLLNEPPVIWFSSRPALLILMDGPAVYRPVAETQVSRVFNTRALILRDAAGKHYLHLFDGYLEAPALSGPWTLATHVPHDVRKAEKAAVEAKAVDLLAGQENPETKKKPSLKSTPVPVVGIASVPTELIVVTGQPQWMPIPGTQLLCISNTTAHVFKSLADQKTYVLISGRWFRSAGFDGPWEYVWGSHLPADFANISDDSPQENVKASVPGTEQARESAIANGIPNTVRVDRHTAAMDPPPQYDGAPQLKPIAGTPLSYVVNSPTPVIEVDSNFWYACENGVWFVATTPDGTWVAATNVPPVIYSIPPSSPLYYVVYARVYNFNEDYIWVGITPGYYGTYVCSDGTVVYGTGYYYPPYVGETMYVSYPVTYGYGSNPCWTPWAGWAFGFSAGWATDDDWYWWCACPPAPFWGAYWYGCYWAYYNAYGGITAWGPYGWAGTTGYIYTQNGSWSGVSRAAAGYNAWTGNAWAARYGTAYNSMTGTRVAGQRSAVANVYTGNYAYGGRGVAYNGQSGIVGAGGKVTVGNAGSGNQGTVGRVGIYNPNTGNTTHISGGQGENGGFLNVNGHVIVGNDGNYYRPNGQGGWEQVTRPSGGNAGQWQTANPGEQERRALNNEFQARQNGAQRQQSFQNNRPAYSGSRGGGFRGGGGRRR